MSTRSPLASVVSACVIGLYGGTANAQAARSPLALGPGTVLFAGESPLGGKRLYPSPVFQDMNADGRLDVVIGDLWGKITVALRLPGDGPPRFGADEPLLTRDGAPLDFKNW